MSEDYYYRRQLGATDLLPAIGVGIAAGLGAFYLVQLLIRAHWFLRPLSFASLRSRTNGAGRADRGTESARADASRAQACPLRHRLRSRYYHNS